MVLRGGGKEGRGETEQGNGRRGKGWREVQASDGKVLRG